MPLEGCPGETSTRGLDTLAAACEEYVAAGARFAKWRAAFKVGDGCPSERCIETNAAQLAEYAATCQVRGMEVAGTGSGAARLGRGRPCRPRHAACALKPHCHLCCGPQAAGLVPIVEPELLIDGGHDAAAFGDASARVISRCVAHLWQKVGWAVRPMLAHWPALRCAGQAADTHPAIPACTLCPRRATQNVLLEGTLLKPQMIIAGADYTGQRPGPDEVAHARLRVMRRCVPAAIPGIMFLSGGQVGWEAGQRWGSHPTPVVLHVLAALRLAGPRWLLHCCRPHTEQCGPHLPRRRRRRLST